VIERILQQVLTLPMYPTPGEDEINYIAESIETFLLKKDQKLTV
jgi:dTDP-4-amino-4,6-dideoxygalactose transaminase